MSELAMKVMAQKYLSLLRRTERIDISYKRAVKLVGGEKRLERLMLEEKIRYSKPDGSANTMWRINFADVIRNVKPLTGNDNIYEFLVCENLV